MATPGVHEPPVWPTQSRQYPHNTQNAPAGFPAGAFRFYLPRFSQAATVSAIFLNASIWSKFM